MSFKARVKPPNSVWFEDAKLKNLIICQPENRNRFNKIFGGFIMRQAGLRIRIRKDPHKFELLDPDPHSNCGSGSRRAKMTHKNRKKYKIFMF
jgi:hypothetical protein